MNRKELAVVVGLMIGVFLIGFFVSRISADSVTGNVIGEIKDSNYSWTKAICNNGKCIDVLIECSNGEVLSLKPMSNLIDVFDVSEINNSALC